MKGLAKKLHRVILLFLTPERAGDERVSKGRWNMPSPEERGHVTWRCSILDAANAGAGTCQAIEDAAALVRCLCSYTDAEAALRAYEDQRSRRAMAFVRASRRSSDLRQRAPAGLRDALVRTVRPPLLSSLFGRTIRPAKTPR